MIQTMAFVTTDIDGDVERLMAAGYTRWYRDQIEVAARLGPVSEGEQPEIVVSTIRLAANYDFLSDVEYELIQHEDGPSYLQHMHGGDVAYMAQSIDSEEEGAKVLDKFGGRELTMEAWTVYHAREGWDDRSYLWRFYECERLPYLLKLYMKISREEALKVVRPEED